jgi:hypothetical protein
VRPPSGVGDGWRLCAQRGRGWSFGYARCSVVSCEWGVRMGDCVGVRKVKGLGLSGGTSTDRESCGVGYRQVLGRSAVLACDVIPQQLSLCICRLHCLELDSGCPLRFRVSDDLQQV